jgi:hypothetical protein
MKNNLVKHSISKKKRIYKLDSLIAKIDAFHLSKAHLSIAVGF